MVLQKKNSSLQEQETMNIRKKLSKFRTIVFELLKSHILLCTKGINAYCSHQCANLKTDAIESTDNCQMCDKISAAGLHRAGHVPTFSCRLVNS